jgi:Lysozyme like domain
MGTLSFEQVAAVALAAGFPPGPAVVATAITTCESGRDATIVQAGEPYATTGWGLWQITPGDSEPQFGTNNAMLNPVNNARAAHAKWAAAGGFSPWTTFGDGCYAQYMGEAEAAVARVAHLSPKQLAALAAEAKAAGGKAGTVATSMEDWSPRVRVSALHLGYAARSLHSYAHATRRLHPRLRRPKVRPPAADNLLWTPRHEERP